MRNMDKEQAKLILGCYRPNGRDALDLEMRQALELAEHDPELAAWFKREQELDGVVCEKLCECRAPESLKTSIIAGRRLVGQDIRWKSPQLFALAALLIIFLGIAVLIYPGRTGSPGTAVVQKSFEAFRSEMVKLVNHGFDLDVRSGDLKELDTWFMEHATPLVSSESTRHLSQNAMGCKSLEWGGKPVSLVCYRMGEGKVLHLFVMDLKNEVVAGLPRENTKLLESVERLSTASWQENGKAYLLVGHDPDTRITPFL